MNQNDDYLNSSNKTSINVDYSADYSSNKLPLWARKNGLKKNGFNQEESDEHNSINPIKNNLVQNRSSLNSNPISSSTPISQSNRTRISLYNSRSTDSDERNSVDELVTNNNQNNEFESPLERLKKKAQQLQLNQDKKLNGGDHNDHTDEDMSINSNKKKNPLYVSTENLKYNDNFFTKSTLPSKSSTNLNLLNTLKPNLAQKPPALNSSSNLNTTINLNSNNSSINNSVKLSTPTNSMQPQQQSSQRATPVVSKRREELAKALSEARAKLQNLDINRKSTGGLSTSMSVANINRLSLNLPNQQLVNQKNQRIQPKLANSSMINGALNHSNDDYQQDAVRRSISLSDLSHNQMLANKSLTLKQQIRNKMNTSNNVYYPLRNFKKQDQQLEQQSQGLWADKQDANQQQLSYLNSSLNASHNSLNQHNETRTHKPIRVRMSRSSSMASINKNDSLLRNSIENFNKPQGLWNSPSSLSINTLRSTNSTQVNHQQSSTKFNQHHKSISRKSSDEDESSDDDLYHRISQRPSTPPKPNILRQLRRSSTTSNNLFLPNNNAQLANHNGNLTLQNTQSTNKSTSSHHKANRKNWSNNFELRPAKSEYNLNSMGQETLNSPSSGFWSNHSNSNEQRQQNQLINGNLKKASSKQHSIGYDNYDLASVNPATVKLSSELFQHIIDELNHLSTFAKKIHYRAQAEENEKLCNQLKEGVSKAYVNLATIVPFSSNNVIPITNSLNNSKETTTNLNYSTNLNNLSNNLTNGQRHQSNDSSNTDHDTEEDVKSNLSSPLNNNKAAIDHVSLTSDSASSSLPQESAAMNLLQMYSERLLSMVENQVKSKYK